VAEDRTPEKLSLTIDTSFVSARAQILALRPKDSPKRQLSAAAAQMAAAAFVSGKAPANLVAHQAAPKTEQSAASAHLLELVKGGGGGDKKADTRAQIRAKAADARAQFAQAAAVADNSPPTPSGRGGRRNRGGARY